MTVLLANNPHDEHEQRAVADALFRDVIRPMAAAFESLARTLGGHGRGHVLLRTTAHNFSLDHGQHRREIPRADDLLPIQRWTEDNLVIGDELLESIKRELLRASGIPEWEPAAND